MVQYNNGTVNLELRVSQLSSYLSKALINFIFIIGIVGEIFIVGEESINRS